MKLNNEPGRIKYILRKRQQRFSISWDEKAMEVGGGPVQTYNTKRVQLQFTKSPKFYKDFVTKLKEVKRPSSSIFF
jgi:hypothetical protein